MYSTPNAEIEASFFSDQNVPTVTGTVGGKIYGGQS